MYHMYPEWGPARHRPDHAETNDTPARRRRYWEPQVVAPGAGGRDADSDRPDDN
jgi:hypothetical protein